MGQLPPARESPRSSIWTEVYVLGAETKGDYLREGWCALRSLLEGRCDQNIFDERQYSAYAACDKGLFNVPGTITKLLNSPAFVIHPA